MMIRWWFDGGGGDDDDNDDIDVKAGDVSCSLTIYTWYQWKTVLSWVQLQHLLLGVTLEVMCCQFMITIVSFLNIFHNDLIMWNLKSFLHSQVMSFAITAIFL